MKFSGLDPGVVDSALQSGVPEAHLEEALLSINPAPTPCRRRRKDEIEDEGGEEDEEEGATADCWLTNARWQTKDTLNDNFHGHFLL